MLITLSDSYIDNAAGKSSKPQIFTLSLKILVGNVLAFLTLWKHQSSNKILFGNALAFLMLWKYICQTLSKKIINSRPRNSKVFEPENFQANLTN